MGNCCGKPDAVPRRTNQLTQLHQNQTRQQQIAAAPHVGSEYSLFFELLNGQTSGAGIRQTFAYLSRIPIEEVRKKRRQFWETRIEGQKEIWETLRNCIEEDDETMKALLEAAEIKLINNSISNVYDNRGQRYEIPFFIVNDPKEYQLPEKQSIDGQQGSLKLILRSAKWNGVDLNMNVRKQDTVLSLKQEIQEKQPCTKIRLFYLGRELLDDSKLGEWKLADDEIVIASCL